MATSASTNYFYFCYALLTNFFFKNDNGSTYNGNIETQQERKSLNFFPKGNIFIMIITHFYIFNPRAMYVKAFIVYVQNHFFERQF